MNKDSEKFLNKINRLGDSVFLSPQKLLDFECIRQHAVKGNTFRGFHREDKCCNGAAFVFRTFIEEKESDIIAFLKKIKCEKELDRCSDELARQLKKRLSENTKEYQLLPYNKTRKLIDLYLEHLVAMSDQLSQDDRKRLVSLLFLPLDSWMFECEKVFPEDVLSELQINRKMTYSRILEKAHYDKIQKFLAQHSKKEGIKSRIYWDLLWGERFMRSGSNLFNVNPAPPNCAR